MVGLVKRALYKCIGNGLLSWTELQEVLLDIEVALNNRPLRHMDEDLQLPLLTLSHFLYGQPNMLPELEPHYLQEHDLQRKAKHLRRCKGCAMVTLDKEVPPRTERETPAEALRRRNLSIQGRSRYHQIRIEEPSTMEVRSCRRPFHQ